MPRANWTRDELILAFNLYCKIPFGSIHNRNPKIVALARILGRSPSSVSWKLANFASMDPSLRRRNIAGASHASKADADVWEEFTDHWDRLAYESERLLEKRLRGTGIDVSGLSAEYVPPAGKERLVIVKQRVNQGFFRSAVLAAYDGACCVTGLSIPEMLVASHIVPWAVDEANRVNPRNGLALNVLHDRAFDAGLMTITPDHRVKISPLILDAFRDKATRALISRFHGRHIRMPDKFLPDPQLIHYHNQYVYRSR